MPHTNIKPPDVACILWANNHPIAPLDVPTCLPFSHEANWGGGLWVVQNCRNQRHQLAGQRRRLAASFNHSGLTMLVFSKAFDLRLEPFICSSNNLNSRLKTPLACLLGGGGWHLAFFDLARCNAIACFDSLSFLLPYVRSFDQSYARRHRHSSLPPPALLTAAMLIAGLLDDTSFNGGTWPDDKLEPLLFNVPSGLGLSVQLANPSPHDPRLPRVAMTTVAPSCKPMPAPATSPPTKFSGGASFCVAVRHFYRNLISI
ncbi:hypothetical protein LZ32DRAFT_238177 [Colletotrichum eremochloae]|nr:hypothetical protein LZ32DRAFT_238177 [Colletotrichum eremochloae]